MKQQYPECTKCKAERCEDTFVCPGKQGEYYRAEIERLNKRCFSCPDNGRNPERCMYNCRIGFLIHKYDSLLGNGDHSRWR